MKIHWWFCLFVAGTNALMVMNGDGTGANLLIGSFCWGVCWIDHAYGVTFKDKV
jgi:hypothetical protein